MKKKKRAALNRSDNYPFAKKKERKKEIVSNNCIKNCNNALKKIKYKKK